MKTYLSALIFISLNLQAQELSLSDRTALSVTIEQHLKAFTDNMNQEHLREKASQARKDYDNRYMRHWFNIQRECINTQFKKLPPTRPFTDAMVACMTDDSMNQARDLADHQRFLREDSHTR